MLVLGKNIINRVFSGLQNSEFVLISDFFIIHAGKYTEILLAR